MLPELTNLVEEYMKNNMTNPITESLSRNMLHILSEPEMKQAIQSHILRLVNETIEPRDDFMRSAKTIYINKTDVPDICKRIKDNPVKGGRKQRHSKKKTKKPSKRTTMRQTKGGLEPETIKSVTDQFTQVLGKNIPFYQYLLSQPEKLLKQIETTINITKEDILNNDAFLFDLVKVILCSLEEKMKITSYMDSNQLTTGVLLKQKLFTEEFNGRINDINNEIVVDGEKIETEELVKILIENPDSIAKKDMIQQCIREPY